MPDGLRVPPISHCALRFCRLPLRSGADERRSIEMRADRRLSLEPETWNLKPGTPITHYLSLANADIAARHTAWRQDELP